MKNITTKIEWHWLSQQPVDDDTTVLLALEAGEVISGFLDAGVWRDATTGAILSKVVMWAHQPQHPLAAIAGLSLLTVIQIRNRADDLVRTSRPAANGKHEGALVIPTHGRPLVSTKPTFETAKEARDYMDMIVQICVAYMAATEAAAA